MNDDDLAENARIEFPKFVRPLMRTPARRCVIIMATIGSLATVDYFYYRWLLGDWRPAGCVPEPTCADTGHIRFAFEAYQWEYATLVGLSLLLLAIWMVRNLKVVDDYLRSARFRNPDTLRKRLDAVLIGIRRIFWGALFADGFMLVATISWVLFFTPN